jgi:predicted S18 family serine protease
MKLNSLLFVALLTVASHACANQGVIINLHLNGTVADRGVCIQMSPAIATPGWACLYKSNLLYKETTAALMAAYTAGKTCGVSVEAKGPDGYWRIDSISCY